MISDHMNATTEYKVNPRQHINAKIQKDRSTNLTCVITKTTNHSHSCHSQVISDSDYTLYSTSGPSFNLKAKNLNSVEAYIMLVFYNGS